MTFGAPSGAFGGSNGDQSGTESRMSTLIFPLNGWLIDVLLWVRRRPQRIRSRGRLGTDSPAERANPHHPDRMIDGYADRGERGQKRVVRGGCGAGALPSAHAAHLTSRARGGPSAPVARIP